MDISLLDASLAGLAELILVIALIIIMVIEWIVMLIMKLSSPVKALLHSFFVNLASLAVGYILPKFSIEIGLVSENFSGLFIGFIISVIVEGLILQVLNKKVAPKKVWLTCVVMNIVSYAGLLIIYVI